MLYADVKKMFKNIDTFLVMMKKSEIEDKLKMDIKKNGRKIIIVR